MNKDAKDFNKILATEFSHISDHPHNQINFMLEVRRWFNINVGCNVKNKKHWNRLKEIKKQDNINRWKNAFRNQACYHDKSPRK